MYVNKLREKTIYISKRSGYVKRMNIIRLTAKIYRAYGEVDVNFSIKLDNTSSKKTKFKVSRINRMD